MNIIFNDVDRMSADINVNVKGTATESTASSMPKADARGISLDISSKVTDNAYRVQGRAMKDVADAAEAMDPATMRDFMVVMSNCVSTEDLNKMQSEGYDPSEVDYTETVSIIDHIKAAMIKGGADVKGYTDSISDEALENITGSKAYAERLKSEFALKDIPLTSDNAENVMEGFDSLSKLPMVTEATQKYLAENELKPTVDNLYTAYYSAGNNANAQARGYYGVGVSGYYAKKPEMVDVEALRPQLEEIVKSAGYEVNEENVKAAAWLVEKGVPLTDRALKSYMDVKKVNLPMSFEEFADHATDAIMDGIRVKDADLSKDTSLRNKAVDIYNEVSTEGTIKGRRVLEEVRLKMTVEANLKLLRSGFSIDTAPMEELIENLREIEKEFAINLTGDSDEIEAVRKKNIFDVTNDALLNIRTAPVNIVASVELTQSLETISAKATDLKTDFEKAGKAYEELMTAPRRDLGDSIKKAFGNIDEILSEMDEALTEENRRAVRILGYNSMEITPDNIASIKEKDRLLTETIDYMTPQRVLSMIRDNVNPLETSLEDLNEYLKGMDETKADLMSFSKFLYKVEKDKKISEDEKEAYIGIYRLVRQLEKNDFSTIGAVEQLGTEFNFENMLSALRSGRHKNMDYRVDESFGGVDILDRGIASITSQIARGYLTDTKDLKEMLEALGDREAEKEFEEDRASEYRLSFKAEAEVISELKNMDMPITAANLTDMQTMLQTPQSVFDRLKKAGFKKDKEIDLSSKEAAKESFEEFTGNVKDFIEKEVFGKRDISLDAATTLQLGNTYRQMDFLNRQAKEENYLVPVELDGKLTAVNLKVVHKNSGSKVSISIDDESIGKLAAEFKVLDNGLSGLCIVSEETKDMIPTPDELKEGLQKEGIELKEMLISQDDDLNVKGFKTGEAGDTKTDTDVISTDKLYKTAKTFIELLSRV